MKLPVAGLIAAVAFCGTALAQYPTRPITLIVPFAAGGPTDVVARTIGVSMGKSLGTTIVVENKVGAGGTIAANYVAKAAPDGYTIFLHHNGMATAVGLYRKLAYDPLKDFEYIGQVADVPMTLLARKDFPANNLQELIRYTKLNEERINLANAGLGAVSHLCGMMLQQAIGQKWTTVPFSGTGPAMTALLGGQVDILCDQTTQTIPIIKGDKVRFYGVTTKQRISSLPDAPTLDEQGLKDFEVIVWHGIYAPKGTPSEAIGKLNNALRIALKDPGTASRLKDLGAEIVPESKQTSEGLRTWLQSEIDKWVPVIRAAGTFAD